MSAARGGAALHDAATLLSAWEAASAAPPLARGAAVVAALAAGPGAGGTRDQADPLDLPLPRLARLAARCHREAFGDVVAGLLRCPACGLALDVDVRLTDVIPTASQDGGPAAGEESEVVPDGRGGRLAVRAPTVRDLVSAAGRPDAAEVIAGRCVRSVDAGPPPRLGPEDLERVDAALERLAGEAVPVLRTVCPGCGGEVAAVLDASALLWERVRTAAPAVLRDVARLAAAFGWSEADVLALSPRRRAAYLELTPQ